MEPQTTAQISNEPDPPVKESALVRAGRVANGVTLERVRFTQCHAQRHADLEVPSPDSLNPVIRFTRPKITRGIGGEFVVSSAFSALFSVGDSDPVVIASIRATVELKYRQSDTAPAFADDDLQEFATVNVPFNSWGYWREFVQSGLVRMGLPAFTIPLFRVQVAREWMITDEA